MLISAEWGLWFWLGMLVVTVGATILLRYRTPVWEYVRHRTWARATVSVVLVCLLSVTLLSGLLPQKHLILATLFVAPTIGFVGGFLVGRRSGVFLVAAAYVLMGEVLIPQLPVPVLTCDAFVCILWFPREHPDTIRLMWRFMTLFVLLCAGLGYRKALRQQPELRHARDIKRMERYAQHHMSPYDPHQDPSEYR